MKTEIEIREAEGKAIIYAIEQGEKSWNEVLKEAKDDDKKIAVYRIDGMFAAWGGVKDIISRRKTICRDPKNLKEEWDYWEGVNDAKPSYKTENNNRTNDVPKQ